MATTLLSSTSAFLRYSLVRCSACRMSVSLTMLYPWLANCYFAHNSLEFPVLLGFCDARSGRPFHPFHRYPGSLAQTWRCPFHRCRVASAQASTPDPESLQATSAESVRVGPDPCRLAGALAAAHSPAPVCHCAEALNPAGPSPSDVQAKIPHVVLIQSQSQARPEGTVCRTRPCGRRNEATQSPLGLSANRGTDHLGLQPCNRQRRGSKDSRPSPLAGTEPGRAFLADFPRPQERKPLEYGSVPLGVGKLAHPLGPGGYGSIPATDHGFRRPCRHGRWGRTRSHG